MGELTGKCEVDVRRASGRRSAFELEPIKGQVHTTAQQAPRKGLSCRTKDRLLRFPREGSRSAYRTGHRVDRGAALTADAPQVSSPANSILFLE